MCGCSGARVHALGARGARAMLNWVSFVACTRICRAATWNAQPVVFSTKTLPATAPEKTRQSVSSTRRRARQEPRRKTSQPGEREYDSVENGAMRRLGGRHPR